MVQSLKLGLSVVTADARHAGTLHRVVIDEPTRTVTAIAVERREPHTHLGDLDRMLMDEVSHQVTALVVRRGLVFRHDVALPVRYVVDLLDDLVHVDIPEAEWDALEEYKPGS